MNRLIINVVLILAVLGSSVGCGAYRIRYVMPSQKPGTTSVRKVSHSFGIGGGLLFFLVHQMFPPWYSLGNPVQVPEKFYEINQRHTFNNHATGVLVSYFIFFNIVHPSTITVTDAAPPEPPPESSEEPESPEETTGE